jgi:Rieske 2Fe-2S family protein
MEARDPLIEADRDAWVGVPSLPGGDYVDEAVFELERERLFHGSWYCVGREQEVAAPGDIAVVDVVGQSLIVTRDQAGQLHALHNACRHRGARLCDGPRNVRKAFTCPYHAWSYGLDGRLLGTPNVAPHEIGDRDALGLVRARIDTWDGFLWVSLSEDAPPLREHLAAHASDDPFQWGRYGVAELVVGSRQTYEVAANWKLIVENYNECLHCPTVHPELVEVVPVYRRGDVIEPDRPDWNGNRLAPGHSSWTATGDSGLPALPGLDEDDRSAFYGVTLLPNLIVNYHTDVVSTFLLDPIAPDRTRVTSHFLFRPETVAEPGFDPSPVVDFRNMLAGQDWAVCERTQAGMGSRAYAAGGVLAYNDRYVHAFHRRYLALRDGA